MRKQFILLAILLCAAMSASARVNVSIGIHVPVYPRLVQVPSYPVYYAPDLNSNYFFYDGQYWVYQDDGWYSSEWYDGPWEYVEPEYVPYFILRVPVRYYRLPPRYFLGWHYDAPPLWHVHWGTHWANRHRGWDHWDRRYVPAPAPLPVYQRNYSGPRYPRHREQQHVVRNRHYDYRSRESVRNYPQEQRRDRDDRRFDARQSNQQRSGDARQHWERRNADRANFDRNNSSPTERQSGRPFDRRRNDDAPRQFSGSPERQLMPPRAEQRESRERRGGEAREFRSRDPQMRMQQQPRQEWDRQRQHSPRDSMQQSQPRTHRQFAQPHSGERSERGRSNGQERNHEGRNRDRGERGRDRA